MIARIKDNRSACRLLIFCSAISLPPAVSAADSFNTWHVYGTNSLRGGLYGTGGLGANSPYPSEGDMYYDELNMYLTKQESAYSNWRGEISGVYNLNDDYRAPDFGVVPERLNLTRTNGEAGVPYKAQFGDYFGYFSYSTVQSSLKGVHLEFQPNMASPDFRQSFVLFTGANQSNWRDLTLNEDYSSGASWLISGGDRGSLSFNFIHNFRDEVTTQGLLQRNQYVGSVAGERPFSIGAHDLVFEGEFGIFNGDHNGVTTAASGQDTKDTGTFVQLSGNHAELPWTYEVRMQRYGQDYRPRGAVVTADRRSYEVFNNWRFDTGVLMRLRAQVFEDAFETNNELKTRTYGVNFSGPLLAYFYPDVSGSLDAFIQNRTDENSTTNQVTQSLTASFSKPLPNEWNGMATIFIQNFDNQLAAGTDTFTRQITVGAEHSINLFGFEGFITPGILVRLLRKGTNDSNDFNPTLALTLARNEHAVRMDMGGLVQNRVNPNVNADVDTYTFNMDYQYRKQQHLFGVETNLFGRDQDGIDSTDAYRLSAYWTYEFDRPPVTVAARDYSALGDQQAFVAANISAGLSGIQLNAEKQEIDLALDNAAITTGVQQGEYLVYETSLLRNVPRRQRLALLYRADILERAAYVVEFDNVGDQQSLAQTFERARQELIRELGAPDRTYDEGEFSASLFQDVNAQRFIRITEWYTADGIIRFGIPRRLDRQVRMEVQKRRSFPPISDTLWSVETVR